MHEKPVSSLICGKRHLPVDPRKPYFSGAPMENFAYFVVALKFEVFMDEHRKRFFVVAHKADVFLETTKVL